MRIVISIIACFFKAPGTRATIFSSSTCRPFSIFVRAAFLIFLFCIQKNTPAQQKSTPVIMMDFVKIKEGKNAEAMYFYENNWKLYRDLAMKKNVIRSYDIVKANPDSLNNFNLILITTYRDSVQHQNSEKYFEPILKEARPYGPVFLNELRPDDFRENIFIKILRPVYSSGKKNNK